MSNKFTGLDTESRHAAEVFEYQAGKYLDDAVLNTFGGILSQLEDEDIDLGLDLITDDLLRLPDGSYLRIFWDVVVEEPDEVRLELSEIIDGGSEDFGEEREAQLRGYLDALLPPGPARGAQRKQHVQVSQDDYLLYVQEYGPNTLEEVAAATGQSIGTAKRKLDGLVSSGKLTAEPARPQKWTKYRAKENDDETS